MDIYALKLDKNKTTFTQTLDFLHNRGLLALVLSISINTATDQKT